MQYPTAWPTVAKEVLVVQGKQTILLTTLINRKQEMKIFQLTLVKPLSTAVTLTSWNWCRTIAIETENWRLWLNGWVIRTVKTLGCQKTICPLPLYKSICNNLHWRNQHQIMQSLWPKFWQKNHQSLGDVTYHVPLLCLFILWPSLTKTQLDLVPALNLGPFMIAANHNILGYLGSPHWRIAPTLCYSKKPQYRHSEGKSFDILLSYHLPNLLLHAKKF